MSYEIDIVAKVKTPFVERFGTPRQPGIIPAAQGEIIFEKAYRDPDSVRGLEEFSHIWLIFVFDRVADQGWKPVVRPPRLGGNTKVGVWASRSPFRPNSLGLSLVKLDRIEFGAQGPVIHVEGIDLTNETPIVDIKPYLPYAEAKVEASGGWADKVPDKYPVTISLEIADAWATMAKDQRRLIEQMVAANPAPAYQASQRIYTVEIVGWSITWRSLENRSEIIRLEPIP